MSKAKKLCATLIAVGLLSTQPAWGVISIPATYAKSSGVSLKTKWNQQAQDALEKLLPFVPELKDFYIEGVNLDENDDDESVIHVHLIKSDTEKYPYASIDLDPESGEIVDFSLQIGRDHKGAEKHLAETKAGAFLKALLGPEMDEYILSEADHEILGRVEYTRKVNGLHLSGGAINVRVNKQGDVVNFAKNLAGKSHKDIKTFPKTDGAVSPEQAVGTMAKSLRLVYEEKNHRTNAPVLKFVPELNGEVNAQTGEVIHAFNTVSNKYGPSFSVQAQGKEMFARTKEEAQQLLREVLKLDTQGMEYQMLNENHFQWVGKNKNRLFVGVDPQTKAVVSMGSRGFDGMGDVRISREEAKEIALETLVPYLDSSITSLHIREEHVRKDDKTCTFYFHKSYEDIPIEDHVYQVRVSLINGKVIDLIGPFQRNQVALPDPEKAVDQEVAQQEYRSTLQARLGYSAFDEDGIGDAPAIVYGFNSHTPGFSYIDAFTGKSVFITKK